MRIESRENVSYSWKHALRIVEHLKTMDTLGAASCEQYSTLFLLAAASGFALVNCSRYARMTSARTQFASMNPLTVQA